LGKDGQDRGGRRDGDHCGGREGGEGSRSMGRGESRWRSAERWYNGRGYDSLRTMLEVVEFVGVCDCCLGVTEYGIIKNNISVSVFALLQR
jgi:hypothetical protein